jgi:hypothetical protein
MSEVRFRARGTDGRVAIYTGGDDAPFDAPLSNLSRGGVLGVVGVKQLGCGG